jgi:hypothetical protein
VNFTAVLIALVVASSTNMSIHHLDVKCAFLYGELEEEIYMRLSDTYAPSDVSVCKLKRSIYGLRQAPGHGMQSSLPISPRWDTNRSNMRKVYFRVTRTTSKYFYLSMSMTYFYLSRHMKQSNMSKTKLGGSIQSKI